MTDDSLPGRNLKVLWLCGLAAWLSVAVYARVVTAPLAANVPHTESSLTSASRAIAPRADAIEQLAERAAGRPAGAAERSIPAELSIYLELHRTRDQAVAAIDVQNTMCSTGR
jgi:hypothetical protein